MEDKIERIKTERVAFDKTVEGMRLAFLKRKVTQSKASLKKLGVVRRVNGVSSSPNQTFLDEVMAFIETDVVPGNEDV